MRLPELISSIDSSHFSWRKSSVNVMNEELDNYSTYLKAKIIKDRTEDSPTKRAPQSNISFIKDDSRSSSPRKRYYKQK